MSIAGCLLDTTYGYDGAGNLVSVTNGAGATVAYTYDLYGNQTSITYPDGLKVTYGYDVLNRLVTVTDLAGLVTSYSYDADSRPVKVAYPNTVTQTVVYDPAGQTTSITDKAGTAARASYTYAYTVDGAISKDVETGPQATTDTFSYGVARAQDGASATAELNLAWQKSTKANTIPTGSYAYNNLGWVTATPSGSKLTYATTQPLGAGNSTGELASMTAAPKPKTTYAYNPDGDRVSAISGTGKTAPTTALGYDAADRLTSYSAPAGSQTNPTMPKSTVSDSFTYNGDGLRMSKTSNGVTGQFAYDLTASTPLVLTDGTNNYVYGLGGAPLEQTSITKAATTYLLQDGQGSTRLLTNAKGVISGSYSYDPFGKPTAHTGTVTSPLEYTSAYTDSDTGLEYLINRYDDPNTMQFLTPDPALTQTGSPYAYTNNNPLNTSDPNGLCITGDNHQCIKNSAGSGVNQGNVTDNSPGAAPRAGEPGFYGPVRSKQTFGPQLPSLCQISVSNAVAQVETQSAAQAEADAEAADEAAQRADVAQGPSFKTIFTVVLGGGACYVGAKYGATAGAFVPGAGETGVSEAAGGVAGCVGNVFLANSGVNSSDVIVEELGPSLTASPRGRSNQYSE